MKREYHADVVVVGAGAAGMYAAIEAKRQGANVLLVDKSMVGRGGATVMAQMTVAAALGHQEPDDWELHLQDTLAGGRSINHEPLAELLCKEGPDRILESRSFGVNWASDGEKIRLVKAPGHSRLRCCYVDILATGTGVSNGLQKELRRLEVPRVSGIFIADLVKDEQGKIAGAAGFDMNSGESVAIWAPAVILAGGGLTELYARNSAAATMTADAHGLALRAGAELVDMEMVQFFPIAHLAPRLIGLDPIMWDPFRYKLGGRLINGLGEEFFERYTGKAEEGKYVTTRDQATYAIFKEVEAGRGSPSGGVYLDFREVPLERMREHFAPVVDKLLAQGIDLTQRPIEVAPTAHYMIGGVRVNTRMETGITGLYAAGEAVGGAHGANRLSGNAITEALVYGHRAGAVAAAEFGGRGGEEPSAAARQAMQAAIARVEGVPGRNEGSTVFLPAVRDRLQQVMWHQVGPFRDARRLEEARHALAEIRQELWPAARVGSSRGYNLEWLEWFETENMLQAAEAVRLSAALRNESRGAHQREDFPAMDGSFVKNGIVRLEPSSGQFQHRWVEVARLEGKGGAQ